MKKKTILSYKDWFNFGPHKGQKVMSVIMFDPSYIINVERTHHTVGFGTSVLNDCEKIVQKRKFN